MLDQITFHQQEKHLVMIIRNKAGGGTENINAYILDHSETFILLQRCEDFYIDGYEIYETASIKTVRFNRKDKYFDKIMRAEGEHNKVGIHLSIDLENWSSVFASLKDKVPAVIIE